MQPDTRTTLQDLLDGRKAIVQVSDIESGQGGLKQACVA